MHPAKLVIPLLLLLSACTTVRVGREFDLAAFDSKVQRGVTTQSEVRGWLGAPNGTGVSVDTGGADSRVKLLQIKFDQRGVVRGYNWSGERG